MVPSPPFSFLIVSVNILVTLIMCWLEYSLLTLFLCAVKFMILMSSSNIVYIILVIIVSPWSYKYSESSVDAMKILEKRHLGTRVVHYTSLFEDQELINKKVLLERL